IFTDNHSSNLEEQIVEGFAKENVDWIINLGDLIEPYRDSELLKIQQIFLTLNKPFISIPGNYENTNLWNHVSNRLKNNSNFIDGARTPIFNYNGISFISIPGNKMPNISYLKDITINANLNKSIILSHEPPKQYNNPATDLAVQAENKSTKQLVFGRNTKSYIDSGRYKKRFENRGSDIIRKFVDDLNLNFVFSGHIHEGLGAYSKEGKKIKEEEYSSSMFFNPGPAKNGIYSIITIDETEMKIKYKTHLLFGTTRYEDLKED
ncbi:MAG: metallophosphoesterase family protein, partial [Candidatus Woesearchaeota archaeon]